MNFCSNCGTPVVLKVPEDDFLPRHVCENCGTIHYQNPKIVVGSVPEYEGRILICKRGIEPRLGHWTIPAGLWKTMRPWRLEPRVRRWKKPGSTSR
jgi:ribosomal protein S27AE